MDPQELDYRDKRIAELERQLADTERVLERFAKHIVNDTVTPAVKTIAAFFLDAVE